MAESEQYESVELIGDNTVLYFVFAVLVAVLTAAFAQVTVPFGPVPFTLQTAGVYLAGLLLGPLWGGLSLALYLLTGIAGAPVFAGGAAGFGVIAGPTGGYLVSYPIAAAAVGAIIHRQVEPRLLDDGSLLVQAAGLLVGLTIVYAVGVPWLASMTDLSLTTATVEGALVFVPGDLFKAGAVLVLVGGGHLAVADRLRR